MKGFGPGRGLGGRLRDGGRRHEGMLPPALSPQGSGLFPINRRVAGLPASVGGRCALPFSRQGRWLATDYVTISRKVPAFYFMTYGLLIWVR